MFVEDDIPMKSLFLFDDESMKHYTKLKIDEETILKVGSEAVFIEYEDDSSGRPVFCPHMEFYDSYQDLCLLYESEDGVINHHVLVSVDGDISAIGLCLARNNDRETLEAKHPFFVIYGYLVWKGRAYSALMMQNLMDNPVSEAFYTGDLYD